jgi:hypothetical protein
MTPLLPTEITEDVMNQYDGQTFTPAPAPAPAPASAPATESLPEAVKNDIHLARRQYEVNEWTISNRRDTLFVLQIIFVGLCVAAILTGLNRKGIVGGWLYGMLVTIILLVIVFTIVRRAQYTNFTRDNRYWNRVRFEKVPGPAVITMPTICPGPVVELNKKEIASLF